MATDEKKKKEESEVICVEFKVRVHCRECARKIQKPIKKCEGVQKVEADIESGKIIVTGKFDSKEMHALIEEISKKKVEIASVKAVKIEEKETEKAVVSKTVIKVQMHCDRCEHTLRRKIQKLEGVKTVTTNRGSHICTVESTIEQAKLIEYVRKATGKHAEIVVQEKKEKEVKEEKKGKKKEDKKEKEVMEEKKEKGVKEEKKEEKEDKKEDAKDKEDRKEDATGKHAETVVQEKKEKEVKEEKKEEKKEEEEEDKEDAKDKDSKKVDKSDEGKEKGEIPVPYFIHCTHAPQLFSDENPNACFVM